MGLNRIDLLIIAAYLTGITLFGLRFRKRQRTMRDYFLADRNIPWWAISLSIVAAETSTLTIISIPGLAYDSNMTFLQWVMGYMVGRVIISFVLLPQYFRGDLYTAYQLIERRFGPGLRSVTAGLFLLTRAAAEGVRVYAVSIVVSIALGTGETTSIAIITLLTLIYTFEGGLAAVIWTDVVQTFIYVGGTLVGLVTILHLIPGGWDSAQTVATSFHKFQMFDFSFGNIAKPYTIWAGIIGGAFFVTASHGTDQLIVQRLLAARNQRQSVLALLSSGITIFFQFALFLFVGVLLFAYYRVPAAIWATRQNLSDIHREPYAARNFRPSYCRDPGCCHVEPQRRAEFSVVELDDGFLFSFSSGDERRPAPTASAHGDGRLGTDTVRPRHIGAASRRTCCRSRIADCIDRLWGPARGVSPGSPDSARKSGRGHCRSDLRPSH